MAHQRKEGWRVSSFQAPSDLIKAAAAKAKSEGSTLSAVIRQALVRYVGQR